MKLKQAESKWNFQREILGKEIEKLKVEVAEAELVQLRLMEENGRIG